MPSTSPSVREHFETPEIVAATESSAAAGLWDVESRALGVPAQFGGDGASEGDVGEAGDPRESAARGAVLVDLGCGAGRSSIALATGFEEVVLMDLSPRMLTAATAAVAAVRGGSENVSVHHLDLHASLAARPVPTEPLEAWERDLSRADLVVAANVMCFIQCRDARVRMLRAVLERLAPDARLLVTNHVVPPEGVQELRDMARSVGQDPATLGDDALLDTTSQDGSFVHWFTPDSLAAELRTAADGPVDLKVSDDGLRAAAMLRSAATTGIGRTG